MKIYIPGTAIIVTLIFCLVFWQQIATAILMVGYIGAGLLGLGGGIGLFFGGWYLSERIKMIRAQRRLADRESHVLVVNSGNQVFIRDTDHGATWRAAHLDPRFYANGQYSEPTPIEAHAYEVFHAPRLAGSSSNSSPAPLEVELLDLLTVFTQPGLSYAIIGGQQSGKTFQARHLANYWLGQGIQPIIIGPKWDKGEWGGCILLGGNGNFEAVAYGITVIRQIVETRHTDTLKSHKEHKLLPIFFDDWTPIVDAVPNARALVLEATTLYASVNVLLYFILHSDTANAWGVDRKGAALKDNFVKLFIVPQYDPVGLIMRGQTRGYIRFAGEDVDRPARLFTAPPLSMGQPKIVPVPSAKTVPNEQEQKILDLHVEGKSHAAICEAVWGYKSSNKYPEIDAVLAKFGAVQRAN